MELQPAAEPIKLAILVKRLVDKAYQDLRGLAEQLKNTHNDLDRKTTILECLESTRSQFVRLLVLLKWCTRVTQLRKVWDLQSRLEAQDSVLRGTADSLFELHSSLQRQRAPNYDIPSAIDVLTTGSYRRLPTTIKAGIPSAPLAPEEIDATIKRLDDVIRLLLFDSTMPREFTTCEVEKGAVLCRVKGEFEVVLTLKSIFRWNILHLKVLIAPKKGLPAVTLQELAQLHSTIQTKLDDSYGTDQYADSLSLIYTDMHEFCLNALLKILRQQATFMKQRWTGLFRLDHSDATSLRIGYWADLPGSPFISIFVNSKRVLCVSHSPPLIDPTTGTTATLSIDLTALDLEALLVQAVSLHTHSLLDRLYRLLKDNDQLDIENVTLFTHPSDALESRLEVQLTTDCLLSISVNNSTGHYLLHLPSFFQASQRLNLKTIHTQLQDKDAALQVIVELKTLALLNRYERVAASFGFEAPQVVPFSFPHNRDSPLSLTNSTALRFPGHPSFYLIIHIDSDFHHTVFLTRTGDGEIQHVQELNFTVETELEAPLATTGDRKRKLDQAHQERAKRQKGSAPTSYEEYELKKILASILQRTGRQLQLLAVLDQLDQQKRVTYHLDEQNLIRVLFPERASHSLALSVKETNRLEGLLLSDLPLSACQSSNLGGVSLSWQDGLRLTTSFSPSCVKSLLNAAEAVVQLANVSASLPASPTRPFSSLELVTPLGTSLVVGHTGERFTLHSQTPAFQMFLPFWESLFDSIGISAFAAVVDKIAEPILIVHSILSSAVAEKLFLPVDVAIVARGVGTIRLIYRQVFSVQFDLLHPEDDITFRGLAADSSKRKLLGLERLAKDLGLNQPKNSVLIFARKHLGDFLKGLLRLMGGLDLYHALVTTMNRESVQHTQKDPTAARLSCSISVSGIQAEFWVDSHRLEVAFESTEENRAERQCMAEYFARYAGSAPYRTAAVESFIPLLSLPAKVLSQLVQIMQLDLEPAEPQVVKAHLLLHSPDQPNQAIIQHSTKDKHVMCGLQFTSPNGESYSLVLQYSWTLNTVTVDKSNPGDVRSALVEQLLAAKPSHDSPLVYLARALTPEHITHLNSFR